MRTKDIIEYYNATENRGVRDGLKLAISHVGSKKVAIDCGCGAGSDIVFLRKNGFEVHAFDFEDESIQRCRKRFCDDDKVMLSQDDFASFPYPRASLVLADASLFFCSPSKFEDVWSKITESLDFDKGVFCGSFLGPNDSMAGSNFDKEAFWDDILIMAEQRLRTIFETYEIINWTEYKELGKTVLGKEHNWHIYSIVAKKR